MTRSSGKRWLRTLALFLLLLAAARFTDCSPALFWARRSHLTDLISAMLPPDWGYAPRILAPLLATVQMSVTGTALGSFLALLLAPLCAENLHAPKPLRWTLRLLVQVLRSFPTLILALLATFLFGLGTFSGTVAITVYTFAILTRLTYEDIESAELAPYHALCAMGAAPAKVYWRAVVPGIAPSYFSNVLYLLETNVRHSSILGYVGAGGIGLQLNEKQKVKFIYGVLEKQFHAYYESAAAASGKTGDNLLILVERRLDNVVYRMGLAATRRQARQLVSHAHFTVNGKKVNIPSYQVKAGDVIEVRESSRSSAKFAKLTGPEAPVVALPAWLNREAGTLKGVVAKLPERSDIDYEVAEHLIVELYSK